MDKMPSVAVVLGTYNGEQYLKEQIDSILMQEGVKLFVFVRDDSSTDCTMKILRRYKECVPNFYIINEGNTKNKGIKTGFIEALKWALSYSDEYDFFAFSDQDDVWLPRKLISGIDMLSNSNCPNGALYYSNKTIVNEKLEIEKEEHFKEGSSFSDFYFVSKAYGCTMIINRNLAMNCVQYVSKNCHFHDDWIHRLAICLECDIFFDNNSYILYRQHGENNCGTFATDDKPFRHLVKRTIEYIKKGGGHHRAELAQDIIDNYQSKMRNETINKLYMIANYKKSLKNKIKLLKNSELSGRKKKDIIIWKIKVLMNYF